MIGLVPGVELLSAMCKESYSGFKYKLFLGALENLAGYVSRTGLWLLKNSLFLKIRRNWETENV
jgi:hypothetical protein